MRVLRIDRGVGEEVKLRSPERTSQGFLRVDAYATRAGVLEYPQPDGTVRRELRPEEEVFAQKHLDSFRGAPVTDGHPSEMVGPENAKRYQVGTVLEPGRRDGDRVAVTMDVTDGTTQSKMRAGKREMSPGYMVDLEETPGNHPKYGRYDAVQRNIVVNHQAIVHHARAGSTARVRMDGADALVGSYVNGSNDATCAPGAGVHTGAKIMPDLKTDQDTIAAASQALASEKQRADEATAALATERTRADQAEGAVKALEARIEELKTTRVDAAEVAEVREALAQEAKARKAAEQARLDAEDPDKLRKAVAKRVNIEAKARDVLGASERFDDVSDRDLMKRVVEKLRGVRIDATESDDHVRGCFEYAVKDHAACSDALRRVREAASSAAEVRTDDREARAKAFRDQWKAPLPNDIHAHRATKES